MATAGEKDFLSAPPSKLNRDQIASEFPLHWFVWNRDASSLEEELALDRNNKEKKDPRGRTALHLAVTLGYVDCVKALVHGGCDANAINQEGWNVSQEAISTGDPEIVSHVLQHRDFQRGSQRLAGIPDLLEELKAATDFYVEMKWEFTSWVPFMSRMCPSDTYKIYKSGAAVRVDTTLLGFDQNEWQRGNRTYVFKADDKGGTFLEIDHERRRVWTETLSLRNDIRDLDSTKPSEEVITSRMTSPLVTTILDTDKIAFQRHKTMWGWGGDKTETVDDYECKVYTASGVEVVTKTRVEHLADEDRKQTQTFPVPQGIAGSGLQSFLGIEEENQLNPAEDEDNLASMDPLSNNPYRMTLEEYFNPPTVKDGRDVGKLKEMSVKKQKFRATISMADPYPLSLQEQVLPIIKLLAISNAHFAKLRDFIALHLPSGFPVKIEIPLFHVLNAKITFANINALESDVTGVNVAREPIMSEQPEEGVASSQNPLTAKCKIEEMCFEVPTGYRQVKVGEQAAVIRDEEDELLQLAIQQSLLEYGGGQVDAEQIAIRESLSDEDVMLQRAIRESIKDYGAPEGNEGVATPITDPTPPLDNEDDTEDELLLAMALSEQQQEEDEKRRRREEEELQRVLQLSMSIK
ncbi:ankyrin repeat domain-containing protein 13D [Nematostella vectensis]|uniref:ankyrin repeat domain-containing protein 13D n=1 Tax=Nematostella vectensis TaxID=45351 RepID=UPI002077015D|nr:ankyrin repeat domain-containing protein 13D [Nematostella vectensis]